MMCRNSKRFFTLLRMRSGKKQLIKWGTRGAKISRPPLRAQGHILKDSSLTLRMTGKSGYFRMTCGKKALRMTQK